MYAHPVHGHYIKRNHSRALPKKLLVLDTETKVIVKGKKEYHRLKLAWSVVARIGADARASDETWRAWNSAYLLCKYIESEAKRDEILWVAGVNVFFDLQASDFFYFFTRWGWHLDFNFDKGTTYILIVSKARKVIKVVSTTNYWTHSARALGKLFGMHKADPDFSTVDDTTLSCYCFRDTEIALESMYRYIQFVHDNDLGAFRASRASQSYAAFRHRFMSVKLFAHDDEKVRELERSAYFGGRVEAYQIGECRGGPFACYDVNSMYPYVMSKEKMPVKCVDYMVRPPRRDVEDLLIAHGAIAKVEIETEEPIYAVHYSGKTVFPVGRFTAFLCTGALQEAFRRGHVRRVFICAAYQLAITFAPYIQFFYAIREKAKQDGEPVWNRAAKIFMNALYGKFGQKRPIIESDEDVESECYSREESYDIATGKTFITTTLLNRRVTQYGEESCPGTVIAIPAHVTEYARLMLWSIIRSIGVEKVLYSDTDSILLSQRDSSFISHPISTIDLGALSLKWTSSTLTIHGCKDYITDREIVVKGIPRDAKTLAPGRYEYTEWPKQRTHLIEGEQRFYVCRRREKLLSRTYDKGIVTPSGRVKPFRFPL